MMGYYYGQGFGFGWIVMLVFWGLVIWAITAAIRHSSGHGAGCCGRHGEHGHSANGALGILKERYAKGELSKEQFEQMKKDLE